MNRLFVATTIALATLAALASANAQNAERLVNGIAAVVNEEIITQRDILLNSAAAERQLRDRFNATIEEIQDRDGGIAQSTLGELEREFQRQLDALYEASLDELVEQKLILKDFSDKGFDESLVQELVDERLEEIIRESYNNDPLDLTRTLALQGETEENFRRKLREQIVVNLMASQKLSSDITVSPFGVQSFYDNNPEEFTVDRSFLLRVLVISKLIQGDDAGPLAAEIVQKLDSGVPFDEMAGVYSDDPTRRQGGSWGWIDEDDQVLRGDLAAVAFELGKGERGDLVERPDAFYIFFVEDISGGRLLPLSEVRDGIVAQLEAREQNRLRSRWINRLKEGAYIRYY